jgi:hypothetical protein
MHCVLLGPPSSCQELLLEDPSIWDADPHNTTRYKQRCKLIEVSPRVRQMLEDLLSVDEVKHSLFSEYIHTDWNAEGL